MPSGGVVLHVDAVPGGTPAPGVPPLHYLLAIGSDGELLWQVDLSLNDPALIDLGIQFAVDGNGNVALQRRMRYRAEVSGTAYQYPAVRLQLLSGFSGQVMSTHELRGTPTGSDGTGYDWHGPIPQVSIAKGLWFVPAKDCTAWPNCDNSTAKLYAVKVPGLQMEYPRGGVIAPPGPALNYVAMGDSFSSGEGVPGFEVGTDTAGPPENRCHRSEQGAYPKLLVVLNLNLTGFVACSGATIDNVLNGQFNEDPQLDALNANTQVVTISIGGNNVPFKELVTACLFDDCSDAAVSLGYFANLPQIGAALGSLYEEIHDHAPNAKVYVLGYPQLLPTQGCSQSDGWMSLFHVLVAEAHNGDPSSIAAIQVLGEKAGLSESQIDDLIDSGAMEFTVNEVATARSLVVQLNGAIATAVTSIGQPWLVYVDPLAVGSPFVGHELCTAQPYFNGLTINPSNIEHDLPYSYHPNALGQGAHRQLLMLHM